MPLSDVMAINVVAVPPAAPLAEVASRMIAARVGSALVCDGPALTGILTERDVLRAVASGAGLAVLTAADVMTSSPVCASPDWEIDDAARVMVTRGIRHLPVTQDGNLAGMISMRDLVRFGVTAAGFGSETGMQILEAAAAMPALV